MQSTTKLKSRSGQVPQHWRGVLPVHSAAELLPRMSDTELNELGDDIRRRGLQTPIAILVGEDGADRLLDGISRLDAMELVGLPVVVDGELNSEIVPTQNVAGNVDPVGYVLSANVHRRHLTGEQKRALIEKVLKVKPEQSDRTTAKQVKADHKTVGKVRDKLEARGEIPHAKTRTDTKGRKQPARKPTKLSPTTQWMQDHPDDKPCPVGAPWAAAAWRRARGIKPAKAMERVSEAPEVEQEKEPNEQSQEDSVAMRIIERNLGSALPALSDEFNLAAAECRP